MKIIKSLPNKCLSLAIDVSIVQHIVSITIHVGRYLHEMLLTLFK